MGSTEPHRSSIKSRSSRFWIIAFGCAFVFLLIVLRRPNGHQAASLEAGTNPSGKAADGGGVNVDDVRSALRRSSARIKGTETAEQIVASKLARFAASRRDLMHELARRHNVTVPPDVERFFDAIGSGNWDDIVATFNRINGGVSNAGQTDKRPPGVEHLWPAIIDAYGVAEQAHIWPAQKLLDYGNSILDSLRPGMVYVGGTDAGRWIPELLNDTSDGERHIIVTQNALADGTYLEYLRVLYDDRMGNITPDESKRAFDSYVSDAQSRLEHDRLHPDEPKQVRAGEDIRLVDGKVQVSGMLAVMSINERILQTLIEKNPDLSFALQESSPLRGTYADALPLGPLMELKAAGDTKALDDRVQQSLDYWRSLTQNLLSDSSSSESSAVLKTYAHDMSSAANLLAAHGKNAEAEEAYRLSTQLFPSNIDAVTGLSEIFMRTGRASEAQKLLQDFARSYPEQRTALERFQGSITFSYSR